MAPATRRARATRAASRASAGIHACTLYSICRRMATGPAPAPPRAGVTRPPPLASAAGLDRLRRPLLRFEFFRADGPEKPSGGPRAEYLEKSTSWGSYRFEV